MPTYGYRCTECGNEFDVWQRMSDEPVAACPVCGKAGKRLIFPAGIVFKGTGFYKTDSRSGSSTSPSSSSSSSPSSSASSNGSASAPSKEPSSTGSTAPAPSSSS